MLLANRLKVLLSSALLCIPFYAVAESEDVKSNEEAVTFTAYGNQSTEAYEGYYLVPENRNNVNSRNLKIHYVRFPSLADNPGSPIVYLAGGPGGSGIDAAKGPRFALFQALRKHADVIALEQRGTGLSEDVAPCRSSKIMHTNQLWDEQSVSVLYQQAFAECRAFWQEQNADIMGYTTVQNALDIEALRVHLDADKLTLWGISYGSHLALASLKLFPQQIDKMILASAEGLDQTVKLPQRSDVYFTQLQEVIDQQPELHEQFPDVVAMMRRVHAKLDAEPLQLAVAIPQGEPLDFLFQRIHMQMLVSSLIADPGRYIGFFLSVYKDLDEGGTQSLQQMLSLNILNNEPITMRLMPTAMDIASGISTQRLDQVNLQSKQSLLGGMLNFPMPQLAGVYRPLDLGDEFRQGPVSEVPTLLLTGTLDGRTYPVGQMEAVAGLSQLQQVKVINAGHNLFVSSPKVVEVMEEFLTNGTTNTKRIELPLPTLGL